MTTLDNELLKKKFIEQSRISYNKNVIVFTKFLNLNGQSILCSIKKQLTTSYLLFGGYTFAERQMVAFIPDETFHDLSNFPIDLLKISLSKRKFSQSITHRDVLGTIMSLGLNRDVIGDIIVREKEDQTNIYIFCDRKMSEFIIDNLTEIKRTRVIVQKISMDDKETNVDIEDLKPVFKSVNELIVSNRIDVVIAKAYHFSRENSKKYILAQKVFINGRIVNKISEECNDNDIISVRGCGRFVFSKSESLSKKGKIKAVFKFYQ